MKTITKKLFLCFILLCFSLPVFSQDPPEEEIEIEVQEESEEEREGRSASPILCFYNLMSGNVDLVFERDLGTSCITVRNLTDGGEDTYIHVGVGIKSFFLENEGLYYIRIVTSSGRVFGALFYANIGALFE